MKKVMTENRNSLGAVKGISASVCPRTKAEGLKKAKLLCLKRIGRPVMVVGSSEKATSALNRLVKKKRKESRRKVRKTNNERVIESDHSIVKGTHQEMNKTPPLEKAPKAVSGRLM